MPQENGDRVRVAYNEVVWCVTGTFPPQHSNTGQRSLHCQKGLVDFLLPLGVKAMPSSVMKGVSRTGMADGQMDGTFQTAIK